MKKYILSLIPFILGASCFITFNIIGSEVTLDGTLVEPFFLIPIGYLCFVIAIICLLIAFIIPFFNKINLTK